MPCILLLLNIQFVQPDLTQKTYPQPYFQSAQSNVQLRLRNNVHNLGQNYQNRFQNRNNSYQNYRNNIPNPKRMRE